MGRDSAVGIEIRYGLNGPVIQSRLGAKFSAPVQTDRGAHPTFYTIGAESFPRVKRPGGGFDHQPPSSVEVKERVGLCLYSPFGNSWPVLG